MQARFLLGPAGSGKTFRCLAEIRDALLESPEGAPLLLLAPKQATFQLERQLLSDPALPGYTRLQILSFERLAEFILTEFAGAPPRLLNEEGRRMVLRALLQRKHDDLRIFRASARLPGFASQLSQLLRELQRYQLAADRLRSLADQPDLPRTLKDKLHDVSLLLHAYQDWLEKEQLRDADTLIDLAIEAVAQIKNQKSKISLAGLWLDGFAEMTLQELDLLAAFLPFCSKATLAFCLECEPKGEVSWLSIWSVVSQTFRQCHQRLAALPDCQITVEVLSRDPVRNRFANNPILQHLEKFWADPKPMPETASPSVPAAASAVGPWGAWSSRARSPHRAASFVEEGHHERRAEDSPPYLNSTVLHGPPLRILTCANPEAEAVLAAREILRFVRAGGRFRDVAVVVRQLDGYHDALRRAFTRYEIPFFLDRREPVAHHPLAELTRYALRTVAFGWEHSDWFGALKTGLAAVEDDSLDHLENEALARGWHGKIWFDPIQIAADSELGKWLETIRRKIVPPFQKLSETMERWQCRPTGAQLSNALRELWRDLRVEKQLEKWSATSALRSMAGATFAAVHETVWEQMNEWLRNFELAFPNEPLSLIDWLPIVEAGLANLTIGVVPPALDQVLVGTIDRSRNPELQCALVLGMNEGIFPAPPPSPLLLSEADRETLDSRGATLGSGHRQQLGLERYYGYIACTRARKHLVVTCAKRDAHERSLNSSPFIDHLRRLFPDLPAEEFSIPSDWLEIQHRNELVAPLLKLRAKSPQSATRASSLLAAVPSLAAVVGKWDQVAASRAVQRLSPGLAEKIYGPELHTSVSALEDFAACPFKFFAARGLRAQERMEFEVDPREKGSFQHEVLQEFHRRLQAQEKRWRDITGDEARRLIRQIGEELLPTFRDGLFLVDQTRHFAARMLIDGLEKLIAALTGWSQQYKFDPHAVEVSFGLKESGLPAWRIKLDDQHALLLRGRIDRVDLCRLDGTGETLGVVIDYKSSARELDSVLMHHGLELQLLAYLGALSQLASLDKTWEVSRLLPAGVFYVSLKGAGGSARSRDEARANREQARNAAYQHRGLFDGGHLAKFDNRGGPKGDQFRYSRNINGAFSERGNEALPAQEFQALIAGVAENLREHGSGIYAGHVEVAPYRWKNETACDFCAYRAVCRFDPWTEAYRVLRAPPKKENPSSETETPGKAES